MPRQFQVDELNFVELSETTEGNIGRAVHHKDALGKHAGCGREVKVFFNRGPVRHVVLSCASETCRWRVEIRYAVQESSQSGLTFLDLVRLCEENATWLMRERERRIDAVQQQFSSPTA